MLCFVDVIVVNNKIIGTVVTLKNALFIRCQQHLYKPVVQEEGPFESGGAFGRQQWIAGGPPHDKNDGDVSDQTTLTMLTGMDLGTPSFAFARPKYQSRPKVANKVTGYAADLPAHLLTLPNFHSWVPTTDPAR